jgi:hypothetical protein
LGANKAHRNALMRDKAAEEKESRRREIEAEIVRAERQHELLKIASHPPIIIPCMAGASGKASGDA